MTESLLEHFAYDISDIQLIPSKGGRFEVIVDDELIYSKLETKRHVEKDEIENLIRQRMAAE